METTIFEYGKTVAIFYNSEMHFTMLEYSHVTQTLGRRKKEVQKLTRVIVVTLIFTSAIIFTSIVYAPPSYRYEATSNYHGEDVPVGTPVIVTASTNDPGVVEVFFRWREPPDGDGPVSWEETKIIQPDDGIHPLEDDISSVGDLPYYAFSIHAPDVLGDWGVQVFFLGPNGKDKSDVENVVMIRATSFNATPEIPLGTIGAATVMVLALAFYMMKQKRQAGLPLNT